MNGLDLAKVVSCKKSYWWNKKDNKYKIAAIDFGIKHNILRLLESHDCSIKVFPAKVSKNEVLKFNPDGLFLSNGPGDPAAVSYGIDLVKFFLEKKLPIFGICLGHQILSIALGAKTYKMKFGHRGCNHPVKNHIKNTVEITSQNHGFCIDENIKNNIQITHTSLNDNTVEGIKATNYPALSVQYHPESSPGPHDSRYLFNQFIKLIDKSYAKRNDINSILIIGAGPIIIGQACEFDYSGTQACQALREEGYRVILINSNPATIMTDKDIADATYLEPIEVNAVEQIIIKEKPDAILPTVGGQTALDMAMKLDKKGILKKYKIKLIGANIKSIETAENREKFKESMSKVNIPTAKGGFVKTKNEALKLIRDIGFPVIIRPSFTMGGTGGSTAYNIEEFSNQVQLGLRSSPIHEVLIEESLLGWKEFEMEVVKI